MSEHTCIAGGEPWCEACDTTTCPCRLHGLANDPSTYPLRFNGLLDVFDLCWCECDRSDDEKRWAT